MVVLKRKSTWLKLLEAERKSREDVLLIQGTMNREMERLEKKITDLENKILDAQEKNQQLFYKKEKELKEQVELGIIDNKEFHYSQRLLLEIEKALK
jgi:hypothetical protein